MPITGNEIYKRTPTYDRDSRSIRLHAPQWKLLLAFDGERTLIEVAQALKIALPSALPDAQNFLAKNWIEEQPITLEQYLKRTAAEDADSIGGGLVVPPAASPKTESTAATPVAGAVPHTPPPLPVATASPVQVVSVAPVAPVGIATPKAAAPVSNTRPMRLSAVVDFITSLVGNIGLGQLLVYRVFLRVPPELLLSEDVASVHLVQDTSIIKGDKLQRAIADAVNAAPTRASPDS